jgi:hypothetical protein
MLATRGFYDQSSKQIHLALELQTIRASGLSLRPAENRLAISRDYVVFEELEWVKRVLRFGEYEIRGSGCALLSITDFLAKTNI